MAQCLILKSFKGSQDGRYATQFNEGEVAELSEYLMANAPADNFQRIDTPAKQTPQVNNKATVTTKDRTK